MRLALSPLFAKMSVFCSGFRDMSSLLNLLKKKQNSH
jgi:hypothetical protein